MCDCVYFQIDLIFTFFDLKKFGNKKTKVGAHNSFNKFLDAKILTPSYFFKNKIKAELMFENFYLKN